MSSKYELQMLKIDSEPRRGERSEELVSKIEIVSQDPGELLTEYNTSVNTSIIVCVTKIDHPIM